MALVKRCAVAVDVAVATWKNNASSRRAASGVKTTR
jgi:hypothetical protein